MVNVGCEKEGEVRPVNKRWFNIEVIRGLVEIKFDSGDYYVTQQLQPGEKPVFNPDKIPFAVQVSCKTQTCDYVVNGKQYETKANFYYGDF